MADARDVLERFARVLAPQPRARTEEEAKERSRALTGALREGWALFRERGPEQALGELFSVLQAQGEPPAPKGAQAGAEEPCRGCYGLERLGPDGLCALCGEEARQNAKR